VESCVGAIGFFFAASAAGLIHFPDVESAPAAAPTGYANVSSAKTESIEKPIRDFFINFFGLT
jgi:hypothetical protein